MKIAPNYHGAVVHVLDASRSVGVVAREVAGEEGMAGQGAHHQVVGVGPLKRRQVLLLADVDFETLLSKVCRPQVAAMALRVLEHKNVGAFLP